jgi:hypothetical protein
MFKTEDRNELLIPLTSGELELVAGGMINQYQDTPNPKANGHQRGELVSTIGYRTFGDVGL